uniref:Phosphatidylinositol specific phospholipase C X domain containing 1 n=1 Tax=Leptobrachium leishanense TaxID=445787 RepID=A0A8C5M166_9ANUR
KKGETQENDWRSENSSHDAMSYCLDKSSPYSPEVPKLLCLLDKCLPGIVRSYVYKWSATQCLNIKEQLDAGIRYLDLRIAHRPDDPSFNLYFVHGFYTSVTVEAILQEILSWLQTHPKEVLILACRNLNDLPPEIYIHFIQRIHKILGPNLTLRNLWSQGYQVIFSDDSIIKPLDLYLWSSIPYWWANTTSMRSLIKYLEKEKQNGRPDRFFTAGLNLTESKLYVLLHPFGSIRKLTVPKLPFLNQWVQKQHAGPQKDSINILAEDLIGSDSFISAVIDLNKKIFSEVCAPTTLSI